MKSDSKIENIAIEFNSADFAFDQSRGTKCLRKLKAVQTIWVYVQLPNWCLHSVGLYRVALIAFITHNLIFYLLWRRYLAFLTHTRVPTSHIPRMLGYTLWYLETTTCRYLVIERISKYVPIWKIWPYLDTMTIFGKYPIFGIWPFFKVWPYLKDMTIFERHALITKHDIMGKAIFWEKRKDLTQPYDKSPNTHK